MRMRKAGYQPMMSASGSLDEVGSDSWLESEATEMRRSIRRKLELRERLRVCFGEMEFGEVGVGGGLAEP